MNHIQCEDHNKFVSRYDNENYDITVIQEIIKNQICHVSQVGSEN